MQSQPLFSRLLQFKRPDLRKHWPILVIVFFIFPLALLHGKSVYAPSDDTYIFLVYARNFLNHHGLTFNGAVVQGYTSILWLVLLCLLGLFRTDLPTLAITLSILSGILVLLATYWLARKLELEPFWALLPVVLLAATGDFAYYMVVGLEEILFTAFIAGGMVLVLSRDSKALLRSIHFPAYLALMILVRPEGALIAGLFLVILGLRSKSPISVIHCGLVLAILLAPVFIAGRIFYGYWLPNTYYIKSNAGLANLDQGLYYLIFRSWSYIALIIAALFIFGFLVIKRKFSSLKRLWPFGLILFPWIVYVAVEGGDNLVGGRLLLPMLPLAYAALIKLMGELKIRPVFACTSVALIAAGLVVGYQSNPSVQVQARNFRQWFASREEMGIYLHDHFPANTLIALDPAGIIPYYSELPTVDMLGLNDAYIAHHGKRDYSLLYAHQAGEGAYVLSRKPDIILLGPSGFSPSPENFISDREIWSSPEFQKNYEQVYWPGIGYAYLRK